MTLSFYLAGAVSEPTVDNWRRSILSNCIMSDPLQRSLERGEFYHPKPLLISPYALPGEFDYVGAYFLYSKHMGDFDESVSVPQYAALHRQCIDLCDVLWAWLPGCGAGTWAEIGYAVGRGKIVVLASDIPNTEAFTQVFSYCKEPVIAPTALEAWNLFTGRMMRYIEYSSYLNTAWWSGVREAVFAHLGKRCTRCGRTDNLQIHHLTYEHVGREQFGELTPLCVDCHKLEHSLTDETK